MAQSQYFYARADDRDVEGTFFNIINKLGRREIGFTITEPSPEAARESEIASGFTDPATTKNQSLYRVTIERVQN